VNPALCFGDADRDDDVDGSDLAAWTADFIAEAAANAAGFFGRADCANEFTPQSKEPSHVVLAF
jgi:hypothetical protein